MPRKPARKRTVRMRIHITHATVSRPSFISQSLLPAKGILYSTTTTKCQKLGGFASFSNGLFFLT